MQQKRVLLDLSKGTHDGAEPSTLGQGWLQKCLNWIPEPTGGLRARRAWLKSSVTGAPATRKCVGIGYFTRLITPGIIQASPVATELVGTSPITAVWAQPTTLHSLLLLVVAVSGSIAQTPTITTPAGWTQAVKSTGTVDRPTAAIYYKSNAASEEGSVAVTVGNFAGGTVQLFEISGIAVSSPLDQTSFDIQIADFTPQSGTTAPTSQVVEFCFAALVDEALEPQTAPTNGFTQHNEEQVNATTDLTTGIYFKITSATGEQSVSATTGTANNGVGVIATFKGWFTETPSAGQVSVEEVVVANNDATDYDFYKIDKESLAAGAAGPWALIGSITAADPSQPVAMTPGFGRLWLSNPQWGSVYSYDGLGLSAVAGSPAGRCLAMHNQRLWSAGTNGEPGVLRYSAVGDPVTWPIDNTIPLERESGEPIEDMVPFFDDLILGQATALWRLGGNDKSDFDLKQLPDGGAAPGRSIMASPIGVIVAGRKQVWLWDGSSPDIISKPIEGTYGLTGTWMSVARVDNIVYVLDQGSGTMWCLNLISGSWHTEELGSGNDAASFLYNQDFRMFAGPKNATAAWGTLLAYREFPGTARDKDFDTLAETYEARTGDLPLAGPGFGLSPKHLHMRIRQRGGNVGQTGITLTPYYDGVAQAQTHLIEVKETGIRAERVDLPLTGFLSTFGVELTQTIPSGEHGVFDVEEILLETDIQETV